MDEHIDGLFLGVDTVALMRGRKAEERRVALVRVTNSYGGDRTQDDRDVAAVAFAALAGQPVVAPGTRVRLEGPVSLARLTPLAAVAQFEAAEAQYRRILLSDARVWGNKAVPHGKMAAYTALNDDFAAGKHTARSWLDQQQTLLFKEAEPNRRFEQYLAKQLARVVAHDRTVDDRSTRVFWLPTLTAFVAEGGAAMPAPTTVPVIRTWLTPAVDDWPQWVAASGAFQLTTTQAVADNESTN